MKQKKKSNSKAKQMMHPIMFIAAVLCCLCFCGKTAYADEAAAGQGKIYEFGEGEGYDFSASETGKVITESESTIGQFGVKGDIVDVSEKNTVPSYAVGNGMLQFFYTYDDSVLNAEEKSWHLVSEDDDEIGSIELGESINKGALVVQTSKDRKNWTDVYVKTNMFEDKPVENDKFYETTDVQLIDGCYYRVIAAYCLGRQIEEKSILFINMDEYEYKEIVEVYEFYAYSNEAANQKPVNTLNYSLGSKVRVSQDEGYFGSDVIEKDDPHYGWDIGQFFVSGYTDSRKDVEGNPVFLKNPGDKVALWFKLEQDISCLDGEEDLSISADHAGSDQYFETKATDFGHGALIIRYTDYNNVKHEPQIYTNYLQANATVGADTKVQLFEEGDYEVALDYEIKNDKMIDEYSHYRIYFKFAVRNGNCMVYPFDIATGAELTNNSIAEDGFYLDLAKSRYLEPIVKKENLAEGADGLTEDTRFNRPAEDGEQYTEEGIYTITVQNKYTNQTTSKKIYVGTNNILKAHMVTGVPVEEIQAHVAQGGKIDDDGNIIMFKQEMVEESSTVADEGSDGVNENSGKKNVLPVIVGLGLVAVIAGVIIAVKKSKGKKDKEVERK